VDLFGLSPHGQIRPGKPADDRGYPPVRRGPAPAPPESLGDNARRIFIDIVSAHPAAQFKPGDLTVLCRYCELVALAERAAFELERDGVVLPDCTLSKWFAVHASTTKQIGVLAARLKIGPSSREKRQSKKDAAPVSVYDQLRMRKDFP
jgi:hypothetical protein